jgi:hypothetical protein
MSSASPNPERPKFTECWSAFAIPASGCVLGLALLRGIPELPYGEWLSERLRLHILWPVLTLVLAVAFWRIGANHYRATGRSYFAPLASTVSVVVFVLTPVVLVNSVGAGWSMWWALGVMGLLACAAYWLVKAWFVYSEVWRLLFLGSILRFVRDQLKEEAGGAILANTRARLHHSRGEPPWLRALAARIAAARWTWWKDVLERTARLTGPIARHQWAAGYDRWGSPHCLALIEEHYTGLKQLMLTYASGKEAPAVILKRYRDAGNVLAAYLRLHWVDSEIAANVSTRIAKVRREMLVIQLWFGAPASQSTRLREFRDPSPDGTGLFEHVPPYCTGVREFWNEIIPAVCTTVAGTEPLTVEVERRLVDRAVQVFEQIRKDQDLDPRPSDERDAVEAYAMIWQALATRMPDAVRFDVWFSIPRESFHGSVFTRMVNDRAPEAVFCFLALEAHYRRWTQRLPPRWREGFTHLAEQTAALSLSNRRAGVAALLRKPQ